MSVQIKTKEVAGCTLSESKKSDGHFTFTGTNANDKIELLSTRIGRMPGVALYVNNKLVESIPEAELKSFSLNSKGGDDSIYVDPNIKAQIKINAGDGNDQINCGRYNVTIKTGSGNDEVKVKNPARWFIVNNNPKQATTITNGGDIDTISNGKVTLSTQKKAKYFSIGNSIVSENFFRFVQRRA